MTFFADSTKNNLRIRIEDYFSAQCDNLLKLINYQYYCYHKNLLANLFPSVSGKTVCDVGCGSGVWSCGLFKEAKKIFLLDNNETYLRIAKEIYEFNGRHNFILVKADISNNFSDLGIHRESIDIVWNHAVMELLDNEQLSYCLRNISFMLRRGGVCDYIFKSF